MKIKKGISYIVIPALFTVVAGVIFGFGIYPAAKAAEAKWRANWIMGAPEYAYQKTDDSVFWATDGENDLSEDGTTYPILSLTAGTQYGEILWKKAEGSIPLYYGDSEAILELGAGTYTGYGVPGEGKRILIGAHDTTFFSGLQELEDGDIITLHTIWGSYEYKVTDTKIQDVTEALAENPEELEEELILYTCYPFGETGKVRSERYLVYAGILSETDGGE